MRKMYSTGRVKNVLVTPLLTLLLFTFDTHCYCCGTLVFSKVLVLFIMQLTSADLK